MMNTKRYDHWRFDKSTITVDPDTGWLTMDGTAAVVGVLDYGTQHELVPASTLTDTESLLAAPLTIGHPAGGLNIGNTRDQQVGTVLSARMDGARLRVQVRVTDASAVTAIQTGTRELSPGYSVDLDTTPGSWSGQKYDAIQVKRRYNHLALVDRARGGRQARLDSLRADGALVQTDATMVAVTIDGVEYMVDPAVAAALGKQAPTVDALPVDPPPMDIPPAIKMDADNLATLTAAIAAAAAKLVTADIRADRAETNRQASELGEVVAICRPLLPASYRVDGADVGTLLADSIVAKRPDLAGVVKAHRTDTAYLRGVLDTIVDGVVPVTTTDAEKRADEDEDIVSEAQKRQALRLVGKGTK